jgi:hypothetical protein
MDEVVQPNSVGMLVKYGALGFIQEGGVDLTQTSDAKDNSIFAFDSYRDGTRVEYSLEHEESMEV